MTVLHYLFFLDAFGTAELGSSSEWKIENVINWKHVVEQFYLSQGGPVDTEETDKEKKLTDDGPKAATKDETVKSE